MVHKRGVPSYSVGAIIGAERLVGDGYKIPIINPANEQVIGTVEENDSVDVDRAVMAARHAFDIGPWPRLGFSERRAIITGAVAHVRLHLDELAQLDCLDTGVPLWDIRGRKVLRALESLEFFLDVASLAAGQTYQQNEKYLTYVMREPVGVAAIIAPWNSPLTLASMQIGPAIALGNCCVVKPSEHTPLSLYRLIELLIEGGLPAGVVNLVNGRGPVTGQALVAHPGVDVVKFIGGTETGKSIMKTAADGLKSIGLELGGKSANIVFADADIEEAVDGSLLAIFSNNGQQCLAGSRILVQRSIGDSFIERFVERAANIRVGDPFDLATEVGPLAFQGHFEKVMSYVDVALEDGARLLVGGGRASGFDQGYYFEPTAVLVSDNAARVCQEEIFGPFATIQLFDDLDDALSIANDSRFGLVAYVWSSSLDTIMKTSTGLHTGTVWVNTPLMREIRAPFGGYKHSGIGRDSAAASLDFYSEQKTVTIPLQKIETRKLGSFLQST